MRRDLLLLTLLSALLFLPALGARDLWNPDEARYAEVAREMRDSGSWLLPRLIGLTRAKRFLYLAEELDAATALAWGLIAEVVPTGELDAVARAHAEALAARPTQALAATKRLLHDSAGVTLDAAMHAETMAVELTIRSNDFKEGMRAFGEKRPPEFKGR